jgi:hypothetical protein
MLGCCFAAKRLFEVVRYVAPIKTPLRFAIVWLLGVNGILETALSI